MGINSVCSAGPAGVGVTDTGEMRAVPWKNLDPPQQASHVQGRLPTELMQFRVQRVAEEVSLRDGGRPQGFRDVTGHGPVLMHPSPGVESDVHFPRLPWLLGGRAMLGMYFHVASTGDRAHPVSQDHPHFYPCMSPLTAICISCQMHPSPFPRSPPRQGSGKFNTLSSCPRSGQS